MHLSPSDPDVSSLMKRINKKRLDLQPNFQRGEVWGLAKKQRLIDTIFRGWHIPPVHIIDVPNSTKMEVLDGQQRLAAIRDFIDNKFVFNGQFEPLNNKFSEFDGLHFDELPDYEQSLIEDFTLRILTISDYEPGEPGELFYRLNQPTNLTAAEQRNAYFGEARQQVKELSEYMEDLGFASSTIGFTNSRMAYDDVIAKLLLSLEGGSLDRKITANLVTQRYRDAGGFEPRLCIIVRDSLLLLINSIDERLGKVKLNKATLYSWLFFISVAKLNDKISSGNISKYFEYFEMVKGSNEPIDLPSKMTNKVFVKLLDIYSDRSSSRVADISSIKLRDMILWIVFSMDSNTYNLSLRNVKLTEIRKTAYYLPTIDSSKIELELTSAIKYLNWGEHYDFL